MKETDKMFPKSKVIFRQENNFITGDYEGIKQVNPILFGILVTIIQNSTLYYSDNRLYYMGKRGEKYGIYKRHTSSGAMGAFRPPCPFAV